MRLRINDVEQSPNLVDINKQFGTDFKPEGTVMFKLGPQFIKEDKDNPGRYLTPRKYRISPHQTILDSKGRETHMFYYSAVSRSNGKDGQTKTVYVSELVFKNGELTIDLSAGSQNRDYAALQFLLSCPRRAKSSKAGGLFYLFDEDFEEKIKAETERSEAKIRGVIFDEEYPGYLDREAVLALCRFYNIPGATVSGEHKNRNKLWEIAKVDPVKFLSERGSTKNNEYAQLVSEAADFGILYYNTNESTYHYCEVEKDNRLVEEQPIYKVGFAHKTRPNIGFANWLILDDKDGHYEQICELLKAEKERLVAVYANKGEKYGVNDVKPMKFHYQHTQ
jgi:hypothetical protein